MSPNDALEAEALQVALAGRRIGHRVIVLEQTTSTNDVVAQMAPTSAEGLVVFAERQSAGRGQYGRRWESAARRGLWLSILLRPDLAVAESARLTNYLVEAVAATVGEQCGIATSIKPPNDLYGNDLKIAGVLVEMRVEASGGYCAIAGLGVNVNQTSEDFPPELKDSAGSLAMITGRVVDRFELAIALLRELDARYLQFKRPKKGTLARII